MHLMYGAGLIKSPVRSDTSTFPPDTFCLCRKAVRTPHDACLVSFPENLVAYGIGPLRDVKWTIYKVRLATLLFRKDNYVKNKI